MGESEMPGCPFLTCSIWTAKKCPPVVERRPEACAFVGKITDEIDFYPDLLAQNFLKMPVPLVWDRLASENDRRTFFQGPKNLFDTESEKRC